MSEVELDYALSYEPKGERYVELNYDPAPTIEQFHASEAMIRSLVGPAGSGKSTGMVWEICYFIPQMLFTKYGIKKTRWLVLRNTNDQLWTTTIKTLFEWFDPTYFGKFHKQDKIYTITAFKPIEVEILFRSCDRPEDVNKFRSLELTGYGIDESSEVHHSIKNILRQRIGRYPRASEWPRDPETGNPIVRKFGIESTNPPDIESPDYTEFYGSAEQRLEDAEGFWQKAGENQHNLDQNYYTDMRRLYANDPEWIDRYIEGKPGVGKVGKDVYSSFSHNYHVAKESIVWPGKNFTIYRGWDNTGNCPACVVCFMPTAGVVHILREFWDDRSGIVDFAERVNRQCNALFPDAKYIDWGDPAGEFKFTNAKGGLTSNAQLMREVGIDVRPSVQDWEPRRESVDTLLRQQSKGVPSLLLDPSCNRLIQGFMGGYGYKEVQNGVFSDKPLKNRFSHCLVGETSVATPTGSKMIADIVPGDYVITPLGPRIVSATMNSIATELLKIDLSSGESITCTKDHPFYTKKGLVLADSLQYNDVLESINTAKESKTWEDQGFIEYRNTMESCSIGSLLGITRQIIRRMVDCTCTAMFGNAQMGLYQTVIASTTSMATDQIMPWKIYNLYQQATMPPITQTRTIKTFQIGCVEVSRLREMPQKNGINQMRDLRGIENMALSHGRAERSRATNASIAGKIMKFCVAQGKKVSALLHVSQILGENLALMMRKDPVLSAKNHSLPTSTQKLEHAVRIVKISSLVEQKRVYDLTVEDAHCFYANGVLVGNCHDALQYVLVKLLGITKAQKRATTRKKPQRSRAYVGYGG